MCCGQNCVVTMVLGLTPVLDTNMKHDREKAHRLANMAYSNISHDILPKHLINFAWHLMSVTYITIKNASI